MFAFNGIYFNLINIYFNSLKCSKPYREKKKLNKNFPTDMKIYIECSGVRVLLTDVPME